MKKVSKTLITLVVILGMLSGNICFAEAGSQDGITWFFSTYKYDLPATMIELIDKTFTPVVLPCGDVFVKLDKVLYDGIWMYTSAVLHQQNPKRVWLCLMMRNLGILHQEHMVRILEAILVPLQK